MKIIFTSILLSLTAYTVSADSDVESYRAAYKRALSSEADAYLMKARAELSKLTSGVGELPEEDRRPNVCVLKELLPDKMNELLHPIKDDGVLLEYGYDDGYGSASGGLSQRELTYVFGKPVLNYPSPYLFVLPCRINRDLASEVRRKLGKKAEETNTYTPQAGHDFGSAFKGYSGEWCGYEEGSGGRTSQLRVLFSEEGGLLRGKSVWTFGSVPGARGYVITNSLFPEEITERNGKTALAFRELGEHGSDRWQATFKPDGIYVQEPNHAFSLTRSCDGFWKEYSPASNANATALSDDFKFKISGKSLPVGPHVPVTVKVHLKRDFKGTVKFFSCDAKRFMLLDEDNGEFVKNHTYWVNAKEGHIAQFPGEFYDNGAGSVPPICGEMAPSNEPWEKRYYARRENTEILRLDVADDWYDTHIMEALPLDNRFARTRTNKLLTNYYPQEKAESLLQGLVSWISANRNMEVADRTIRLIVDKYGGKAAAQALIQAFDSPFPEAKRKALDLLSYCGEDKKIAFDAISNMLQKEEDKDLIREVLLLSRNWGFDVPPKLRGMDEISEKDAAVYKERIVRACDRAAKIDLTQKEEYPQCYDEKGVRIPPPPDAAESIKELEELVGTMPNYPEMARAYLLLGRLMQRFENSYGWANNPANPYDHTPPEIKNKMFEYQDGEPGAVFYYNGYHFDRLISLFPNSEYADDAAFEKTKVFYGGECESDENCPLEWGTDSYRKFLKGYPSSDLAGKAIDAINSVFESIIRSKERRLYKTEYFSLVAFNNLVNDYKEAVENVALPEKSRAYDTICTLWEKAGEPEKAAQACNFILKNYPTYPAIAEVRLRAQNFKPVDFRLKPPIAVGYRSVYLEWPPVNDAIRYTIYRASTNSEDFSEIQLLSETTSFQDKNITPSASYKYYIDALTSNGTKLTSNTLFTDIPSIKGDSYRDLSEPNFTRITFFDEEDRSFYVFTYIYNSRHEPFPEVTRVSEDGKDVARFSGLFYGYSDSPLNKFTDNILLIDPIHQKFLRFPKGSDFEKLIAVSRTQNMEIIPDSSKDRKWQPEKGRHIVSISHDNTSAWVINISTDYWSKHDSFAWDSVNNLGWEIRGGNKLIQYKSQDPAQVSLFNPEQTGIWVPMAIHPDEKEGALWVVNMSGDFFKINRSGRVAVHFKTGNGIGSADQVALNLEKNYAWISTLPNDPRTTRLRKISLKDGSLITEVDRAEYISPNDQPRNLSMPMSIDRKTENLWIYNATNHKLIKLSPTGKNILTMPI